MNCVTKIKLLYWFRYCILHTPARGVETYIKTYRNSITQLI